MKRISLILISAFLMASQASFADTNIKLIIDAGHGGKDEGSKTKAGDKESDISLKIAEAIRDYATQSGIAVEMTRTKKNQTMSFEQRSGYKPTPGIKTYYVTVHFDNDKDPEAHGPRVRYSATAKHGAESKKLAETLAKSLEKISGAPSKVEVVDAIVFMKNQVPSILVEPGRMSSKEDLNKIKDDAYRKEVAMFIVQAAMAQ